MFRPGRVLAVDLRQRIVEGTARQTKDIDEIRRQRTATIEERVECVCDVLLIAVEPGRTTQPGLQVQIHIVGVRVIQTRDKARRQTECISAPKVVPLSPADCRIR